MKDEIKEILKDDDELIVRYKDNSFESFDTLPINVLDYITNLQEEKDRFKLRCYKALKLIRDNYGLLDKYGIDMIDDILNGDDD